MSNIFETAKKSSTKAVVAGGKKSDKEIVEIEGLEDLATIKTVTKALDGLAKTLEEEVKAQVADSFVALGTVRKPDNFTGTDGDATASCELRKRSTRSVLSEEEQALLAAHGVSTEVIEDVKETFVINPEYKDDQELLAKVSDAISGIDGLPEDFIVHQEKKARVVTTKNSLDEIFTKSPEVTAQLLSVVGTLAIKPKLASSDISDALDKLNNILG